MRFAIICLFVAVTAFAGGSPDAGQPDVVPVNTTKTADLKDAGVKLDYLVFARTDVDGGRAYVAVLADGGVFKLDVSPCARRPAGVLKSTCLALDIDGGTHDQGDENTMQDGKWTGLGCVRTACGLVFGKTAEKGP